MARIAVLGGTGFLGRHAISRLLTDGHQVRAIVRSPRGADLPADVEIVPGDVTVPGTLPAALAGTEAVLGQLSQLPGEARMLFLLPHAMTAYVMWRTKESGFQRAGVRSGLDGEDYSQG